MRERAALAVGFAALVGAAVSCGAAAPLRAPAAPPPPPAGDLVLRPARYLVGDRTVIERTADGLDRAVVSGRRVELRGLEIVAASGDDPDVQAGARAPAWAGGGPAAYVFWKGKQLWGAETFMGKLHLVAALPLEPRGSFDWLDGVGLTVDGGALVAPPSGAAPRRPGVAALTLALAADARRAVAVTALGHAWLTLDGGASYRDVSAELGDVSALEPRGEALTAVLTGGRERVITAAGTVVDEAPRAAGAGPHAARPEPDLFTDATSVRPLDAAVRAGLPLADGGVLIAAQGFVGRLDVATLRSTSVAALNPGLRDAECTPVRAGGSIVLACVGGDRAVVVDVDGPPRTERSFDLAGASNIVRFVATGDALGYLGACDGTPPVVPDDKARAPGEEPFASSRQRSSIFCVRAGRDDWVEHHLDPVEAADLLAWIPRAGGGAVALVARAAEFLDDRERVSVRGALRVVRVARNEPPLQLTLNGYRPPTGIDQSLRVLADDTIVGWLPSNGHAWGVVSVGIDPTGHVHAYPSPPQAAQIAAAGALALASGEDGHLWETVDHGRTWTDVAPPPGSHVEDAQPTACSAAACSVGGFVRLGWTGATTAPAAEPARPLLPHERYRRPSPAAPLVRLTCAPVAAPTGRRIADSAGFGFTPQAVPRAGVLTRVGALGMANVPWVNGQSLPATGDVEVSWLSPLDVAGVVRRVTLPIPSLGLSSSVLRPYDLHVGYLLGADGGIDTFASGSAHQCLPNLLETAGITRALGGCAPDGSVGVEIGGRVVVIHPWHTSIHVLVAEASPRTGRPRAAGPGAHRPPATRAAFTVPVALHELHENPVGGLRTGFSFGAAARAGAPAVVVVDAGGEAVLSPIDLARGTLGAEERLRPLTEARLGSSPACAPGAGRAADEARVVLPFEGLIGVDRRSIPGVGQGYGAGVALLRWSRERVCLDAVEVPVRDDRHDENPGPYEPHGALRKLVARFDGKGQAALVLVGPGTETRQALSCAGLTSGPEETR